MYDQIIANRPSIMKGRAVIRAIHNPLRLKIIEILHKNGKMTVTEIFVKLRLEQCVASTALAILLKAGLVKKEASGKLRYYSLNDQAIGHVLETLAKL